MKCLKIRVKVANSALFFFFFAKLLELYFFILLVFYISLFFTMHVGRELHHFVSAGLATRSAKLALYKMAGWSLWLDI